DRQPCFDRHHRRHRHRHGRRQDCVRRR
ncbi:MAG: Dethiobiotin synthetase, partial [uncultured Sphingomonadaceae bacterium]